MLRLGKTRWFYIFVAYLAYLLTFGCTQDYSNSFAPTRYTCNTAHLFIYPVWNRHFRPHLEWVNQKTGIAENINPVLQKTQLTFAQLDESYALSYTLDKYKLSLQDWISLNVRPYYNIVAVRVDYLWARFMLWYKGNVGPIVSHYFNTYNHYLVDSVDNTVSYATRHTEFAWTQSKRHTLRFFELQVFPAFSSVWTSISTNTVILKLADITKFLWIAGQFRRFVDALFAESSKINASFKSKTDFLVNEFKILTESGIAQKNGASRATSDEVIDVVKTILEGITSSDSSLDEQNTAAQASETLVEVDEPNTEVEEETVSTSTLSTTVTETLETTVEESQAVSSSTQSEVEETSETETAVESEEDASRADDESEDEPITETIWLTATVYETEGTDVPKAASQDEELSTVDVDDMQKYQMTPKDILEQEILYWKSKVDKMLKMAYGSLEDDMIPVLNATLDPLRDEIAANFTNMQKDNYDRYKSMNLLISKINKDYEHMQETNELIENPEVNRQMMRDEISACREAVKEVMENAEQALNDMHAEIVEQYFAVTQQTVDVIESYAETLISEFSNRLTDMIHVLESEPLYEDKFGWAAWKENHNIKELIFQFRDKIFNEANQYKENHKSVKPRGLEPWVEYVANINFYSQFLTRDNEEYLQLVRAKANVAYQLREALTRQFIEAREKAAEEEAAKIAAEEKAAEEQAAKEQAAEELAAKNAAEAAEEKVVRADANDEVVEDESGREEEPLHADHEPSPDAGEAVASPRSSDNGYEDANPDVEEDDKQNHQAREVVEEEVAEKVREQVEEAINAPSEAPDLEPDNLEADTRL